MLQPLPRHDRTLATHLWVSADGSLSLLVRVDYQPMSIARLAAFIANEPDFDVRWRLVVEFLKEYHQEQAGER